MRDLKKCLKIVIISVFLINLTLGTGFWRETIIFRTFGTLGHPFALFFGEFMWKVFCLKAYSSKSIFAELWRQVLAQEYKELKSCYNFKWDQGYCYIQCSIRLWCKVFRFFVLTGFTKVHFYKKIHKNAMTQRICTILPPEIVGTG